MKTRIIMLGLVMLMSNSTYILAAEPANVEQEQTETKEKAKFCPVCGPEEEMEGLAFSYKYKGQKYAFCSMDCMKEFKKNPEKYLKNTGEKKVSGEESATYTCPMHPEVRESKPGSCPKCGMALEIEKTSHEGQDNK